MLRAQYLAVESHEVSRVCQRGAVQCVSISKESCAVEEPTHRRPLQPTVPPRAMQRLSLPSASGRMMWQTRYPASLPAAGRRAASISRDLLRPCQASPKDDQRGQNSGANSTQVQRACRQALRYNVHAGMSCLKVVAAHNAITLTILEPYYMLVTILLLTVSTHSSALNTDGYVYHRPCNLALKKQGPLPNAAFKLHSAMLPACLCHTGVTARGHGGSHPAEGQQGSSKPGHPQTHADTWRHQQSRGRWRQVR